MGALVYVHRQYEYVPPSMWHGSVVTGALRLAVLHKRTGITSGDTAACS